MSQLITETLGNEQWLTVRLFKLNLKNLSLISKLKSVATNEAFQQKWMAIKLQNKINLAKLIERVCEVEVNPEALFDIQVSIKHFN